VSATLLTVARLGFIALLYGFLWIVARTVRTQLSQPRPPSSWQIAVIEPDAGSKRYETIDRSHIVGRGDAADIAIADTSVSDLHSRIAVSGDSITLQDLGSTNGTFLNGDRVEGTAFLSSGDAIRIGRTIMEVQ
jgi:pSer/pThr/pTyr-binding forkhead associated (FHA) protein